MKVKACSLLRITKASPGMGFVHGTISSSGGTSLPELLVHKMVARTHVMTSFTLSAAFFGLVALLNMWVGVFGLEYLINTKFARTKLRAHETL